MLRPVTVLLACQALLPAAEIRPVYAPAEPDHAASPWDSTIQKPVLAIPGKKAFEQRYDRTV